MRIKVEPFLMKKGNRVAKAAIEFGSNDAPLSGFHLVGFTICDDKEKGLFVLFPASIVRKDENGATKPFFFLRPDTDDALSKLETAILDIYESMTGGFNTPRIKTTIPQASNLEDLK
jgi:hypothetical protein